MLSPAERSTRARVAAFTRWAGEDPRPQMQKAREGFERRFLDEVDPNRVLPEAERNRRAAAARRAHFARLALASARARAARKVSGQSPARDRRPAKGAA